MQEYLTELLVCPACHGELEWTVSKHLGDHLEEGEARCLACGNAYPLREGIPLFLTPDLPRADLWEGAENQLTEYLNEHPEVERQLLASPLEDLAPADQFFRALVLDERGDYTEAGLAEAAADAGLYSREYLDCRQRQFDFVLQRLAEAQAPIVDLASGRCVLVEKLARHCRQPVVATDFSPTVLRRDRRWLEAIGLYDQVSLLAFDARRTPFKDGAVKHLTSNLGLPNVEGGGDLLAELRRVVSGAFLAISHFYPEEDEANRSAIRERGLQTLLFRRLALTAFEEAGWEVELVNLCQGETHPTPVGRLLEGATIDTFPVAETRLTWCVLLAK